MASKLNINKIESYSQALAERVSNEIFFEKKAVTGGDILSLTSIEQVNFFVLKNLFDKWTEEQYKLRSPYFNYENEEVKQSLAVLINKLSNNILIEREFLKPLLIKAIAESLHWIISPASFIEGQYTQGLMDSVERIKAAQKYFKVNKILIEKTLSFLSSRNASFLSLNTLQSAFDDALQQSESQLSDPSHLLEQFGSILSFDLSDLVASIQKNKILEDAPMPDFSEVVEEITTALVKPAEEKLSLEDVEIIPVRTVMPPPLEEANKSQGQVKILNDQFVKNSRTLNEMLTEQQNSDTVNEQLAHTKIHDLRSAISLNKRFQIINELFKGNTGEYLFAIEDIENSVSHTDALHILQEKFAHKYNWTFEDDLLREFLQLIERRFL